MAEHYSFFDPVENEDGTFDREYNAQQFTDYFHSLVTTGVMKGLYNELKVAANGSNMMVEIDTGVAFVQGRYYRNDAKLAHTHDTESLGKNRIDRIVIRRDLNTEARYVRSFIKKGVASTNPVAPALTRDDMVYEISLAQVKIIGGQTYIKATDVTDERGNASLCPWAGSNILPNFDDSELEEFVNKFNKHITERASISQVGHVQLNSSLTNTSQTLAATPYAIKQVNDKIISTQPAIGYNARTSGADAIALGNGASASTESAIAIGKEAKAPGYMGISLGYQASGSGGGIAIGRMAKTDNNGPIAIGEHTNATSHQAIAIGRFANALETSSVAIGDGTFINNSHEGVIGRERGQIGTSIWKVPGNFSVGGTKNFEIPHPAPHKEATHVIRHGAVESPTPGDTLYRYNIKFINDRVQVLLIGQQEAVSLPYSNDGNAFIVEIPLPDYWVHLNSNEQVYVNGDRHFNTGYGYIDREKELLVLALEACKDYHVALCGTRNDDNVQEWYVKGVEREIGESWLGETYVFDVDEIIETEEVKEEIE